MSINNVVQRPPREPFYNTGVVAKYTPRQSTDVVDTSWAITKFFKGIINWIKSFWTSRPSIQLSQNAIRHGSQDPALAVAGSAEQLAKGHGVAAPKLASDEGSEDASIGERVMANCKEADALAAEMDAKSAPERTFRKRRNKSNRKEHGKSSRRRRNKSRRRKRKPVATTVPVTSAVKSTKEVAKQAPPISPTVEIPKVTDEEAKEAALAAVVEASARRLHGRRGFSNLGSAAPVQNKENPDSLEEMKKSQLVSNNGEGQKNDVANVVIGADRRDAHQDIVAAAPGGSDLTSESDEEIQGAPHIDIHAAQSQDQQARIFTTSEGVKIHSPEEMMLESSETIRTRDKAAASKKYGDLFSYIAENKALLSNRGILKNFKERCEDLRRLANS